MENNKKLTQEKFLSLLINFKQKGKLETITPEKMIEEIAAELKVYVKARE